MTVHNKCVTIHRVVCVYSYTHVLKEKSGETAWVLSSVLCCIFFFFKENEGLQVD